MTSTPGHIELERSIDSIRIGSRHRTDLGDIDALADSIQSQGMLQPITVTPEGILVCGARRLAALRHLGVRKVNVWVRSGLSDRLTQLLAERDDNALHKSLTPTEAATLYREVKMLLAEDAQRRQEESRFGSERDFRKSNGAATVAAPSKPHDGYTRAQAALLVTGRRSYTTLDRIGRLQRIAADDALDDSIRRYATVELDSIDHGGSVTSAHRRMSTQLTVIELERLATDATQPDDVRQASSLGVARVQAASGSSTEVELAEVAREALARAKTSRTPNCRPASSRDSALPARSFVFLWNDLREWWLQYDCVDVASQITDEQWKSFEETVAGTIDFAERLRSLRADPRRAVQPSESAAPLG
ncbi:MAG: ParB N-terminal domain-containing protein [Microbacterium sp.]